MLGFRRLRRPMEGTAVSRLGCRDIRLVLILGILAGAVICPRWVGAQETIVETNPFFDTIKVNVVNVEVFVTDESGAPVRGLNPEDFEILVDGDPVEITNFFKVEGGSRQYGEDDGSGEIVPALDTKLPDYQRLNVVVYFDNTTIPPKRRNPVIQQLRTILKSNVGPGDRVMIVSQSGGLSIRHRFSDPRENIDKVLDELRSEVGLGSLFEGERNFILRSMQRVVTSAPIYDGATMDTRLDEAEAVLSDIRGHVSWEYESHRRSISTLVSLVESLAGLPGRKALLYVGAGINMRVGVGLFEAWVRKFEGMWDTIPDAAVSLRTLSPQSEASRYNLQRNYTDLAGRANANRVTFYAIDASQAPQLTYVSAESTGFEGGSEINSSQSFGQLASLQYLSGTTGGRHITNLENIDLALQYLRNDFLSYYSLGFSPSVEPDGKYHKIKVKVRREGVETRHRAGFRGKTSDERMSDRTLSAVFLDVTKNPLRIGLEVGEAEKTGRKEWVLPVHVQIPLAEILLLPMEDVHEGRITIYIAVHDNEGRTSSVQRRELPIKVPNEVLMTGLGKKVTYTMDLKMRGGQQRVAVGIRDELAEMDSTVVLDVDVGLQDS